MNSVLRQRDTVHAICVALSAIATAKAEADGLAATTVVGGVTTDGYRTDANAFHTKCDKCQNTLISVTSSTNAVAAPYNVGVEASLAAYSKCVDSLVARDTKYYTDVIDSVTGSINIIITECATRVTEIARIHDDTKKCVDTLNKSRLAAFPVKPVKSKDFIEKTAQTVKALALTADVYTCLSRVSDLEAAALAATKSVSRLVGHILELNMTTECLKARKAFDDRTDEFEKANNLSSRITRITNIITEYVKNLHLDILKHTAVQSENITQKVDFINNAIVTAPSLIVVTLCTAAIEMMVVGADIIAADYGRTQYTGYRSDLEKLCARLAAARKHHKVYSSRVSLGTLTALPQSEWAKAVVTCTTTDVDKLLADIISSYVKLSADVTDNTTVILNDVHEKTSERISLFSKRFIEHYLRLKASSVKGSFSLTPKIPDGIPGVLLLLHISRICVISLLISYEVVSAYNFIRAVNPAAAVTYRQKCCADARVANFVQIALATDCDTLFKSDVLARTRCKDLLACIKTNSVKFDKGITDAICLIENPPS